MLQHYTLFFILKLLSHAIGRCGAEGFASLLPFSFSHQDDLQRFMSYMS